MDKINIYKSYIFDKKHFPHLILVKITDINEIYYICNTKTKNVLLKIQCNGNFNISSEIPKYNNLHYDNNLLTFIFIFYGYIDDSNKVYYIIKKEIF